MHVRAHRLPDLLAGLLERGEWKRPSDDRILAIPHQDLGVAFHDLDAMESETGALIAICRDYGAGQYYRLAPGTETDGELDPRLAVSIATSPTESGLCLDYRFDPPRIVALTEDSRWVVVAASFEEFWRKYLA